MHAQEETVRGGAPPYRDNLIGSLAVGRTKNQPALRLDTKLLLAACSLARTLAFASLITLRSAHSLNIRLIIQRTQTLRQTLSEETFKA